MTHLVVYHDPTPFEKPQTPLRMPLFTLYQHQTTHSTRTKINPKQITTPSPCPLFEPHGGHVFNARYRFSINHKITLRMYSLIDKRTQNWYSLQPTPISVFLLPVEAGGDINIIDGGGGVCVWVYWSAGQHIVIHTAVCWAVGLAITISQSHGGNTRGGVFRPNTTGEGLTAPPSSKASVLTLLC